MVVLETQGAMAIAAGIAIFGGALGTAWAQSAIGSSAMGVIAEKPEQATKLIIWLAIPETIVIFGFVVALLLALNTGGA
ncbi:MAG: ATPase [Candidatus Diapherotrites archaeon]|uniref:ATPase n=1 Tax=Candidatus Iainarchaeum sp. TaxID=3101447 RepID=A0A7J4ITK1_9ARCH|nr:MAG: V-type H+-transporting ATPase subunit K [archaeon GW2011_AR10]MBS3059818.1 ATPase [Candidatus Diapherotrites archaeon]HIH08782.1 ATPase [Candidatus Diapherotrites archaeon]